MPSCVMRMCAHYTNKTSKTDGITYHSFPSNDERRGQWVEVVRKQRRDEYWLPCGTSRICSDHFRDEDKYKSPKGLTLLKITACPITEYSFYPPPSPTNLLEQTMKDLSDILDTPQEAALKRLVKKLKNDKKQVRSTCKNIKRQNRRLQLRLAKLSKIIRHLKKKNYITDEHIAEAIGDQDITTIMD